MTTSDRLTFRGIKDATHLYKGKRVRLLEKTFFWKGKQHCTILIINSNGKEQRQSVLLENLKPLEE